MICYKCGTFNEDGSAFCYKCGNSLMANGANSSMQGVGVGSGMAANGMQPNGMQPNGMQPNGMYNPGMSGNGMYPGMSGNGYAPIKPKKSYTWLIILIAVLSIIAIGAVSVVLIFFVGNSDDDKVEKSEEKTTIVSEATTEDGTKEVVEDETENATEEKTEDETEVATEEDIEETTEDQNTEYETISIYSDLYEELVGGWDAPGDGSDVDGGAYWEFRNGEYWWYKTKDDLTDNYWYGTTEIITGKKGLRKAAGPGFELWESDDVKHYDLKTA